MNFVNYAPRIGGSQPALRRGRGVLIWQVGCQRWGRAFGTFAELPGFDFLSNFIPLFHPSLDQLSECKEDSKRTAWSNFANWIPFYLSSFLIERFKEYGDNNTWWILFFFFPLINCNRLACHKSFFSPFLRVTIKIWENCSFSIIIPFQNLSSNSHLSLLEDLL